MRSAMAVPAAAVTDSQTDPQKYYSQIPAHID